MREINLVILYLHVYKKDIRFEYRDILRLLFESQNGLQAFSLYSRLGTAPDIILDFVEKYKSQGIIDYTNSETKITLTESGRKNFYEIIKDLELSAGLSSESFLSKLRFTAINKYAPYVPSYSEGEDRKETF